MAYIPRTIQNIKDTIRTQKNTDPNLNGTNYAQLKFAEEGGSKVGMSNNIAYLVAWAQNLQEQLWALLEGTLQGLADKTNPGTAAWLQYQAFKFQYDSVITQAVQIFSDFTIGYPPAVGLGQGGTADLTKRIITACAVIDNGNRQISIKVAKGPVPSLAKLSAGELTAFTNYINTIKFAGTFIKVISNDPDRLYIKADIIYDKGYDSIALKTAIISAITTYLQTFTTTQFNGIIYPSKLEAYIIANVPGVISITFKNFTGRASGGVIITGVSSYIQTNAGYAIPEDTAGYQLTDGTNINLQ